MSQTISFTDYKPPPRYDSLPWTDVRIEESDTDTITGSTVWTQIDSQALAPLDTDPALPEARDITTSLASDTPFLWYRLIWVDAALTTSAPTVPIQNLPVSTSYATVAELFRIVSKNNPSAAQIVAAQGDLDTATIEINAEIDWGEDHDPPTPEQLELMKNVCLNRAADLWRHRESAPGILSVVDETTPTTPGRYSWARYVSMLAPLKDQWGVA